MNLYLITRDICSWDENFAHVIRASNEEECRQLAGNNCADEGSECWLDTNKTRVTQLALNVNGKTEIVLTNFRAG